MLRSRTSCYSETCILPDAISRLFRQMNSTKYCANLEKESATKILEMIRQAFGEESMNCAQRVQFHQDRKMRDRWRAKRRACSSFSLPSKRLFTKNSSWEAKQSIQYTTVTLQGDCLKMCEDFAPNFGDKTGICIAKTHHLTFPSFPRNFWQKATWLSSPTHPTFLCPFNWR
jgi:hypothetical protein